MFQLVLIVISISVTAILSITALTYSGIGSSRHTASAIEARSGLETFIQIGAMMDNLNVEPDGSFEQMTSALGVRVPNDIPGGDWRSQWDGTELTVCLHLDEANEALLVDATREISVDALRYGQSCIDTEPPDITRNVGVVIYPARH